MHHWGICDGFNNSNLTFFNFLPTFHFTRSANFTTKGGQTIIFTPFQAIRLHVDHAFLLSIFFINTPYRQIPVSYLYRSLPAHHQSKRASNFSSSSSPVLFRSLSVRGSSSMSYTFFIWAISSSRERSSFSFLHFLPWVYCSTRYTQMFYLGSFLGWDGLGRLEQRKGHGVCWAGSTRRRPRLSFCLYGLFRPR